MDKEQRLWKVPEQKKKSCATVCSFKAKLKVMEMQRCRFCIGSQLHGRNGKSCFPCLMFLMRQLLSSDVQACKTAYMRLVKIKYSPLF